MSFFQNCKTVIEIKKLYRELARKYHPDLGGDLETMKQVNAEYEAALKTMHGTTTADEQGTEHTYYYNEEVEKEVMQKIHDLLSLKMSEVEINLVGTWVWINGKTKPHKQKLKQLSCLWHSKHEMWYWRKQGSHCSKKDFDQIAAKYGLKTFRNQEGEKNEKFQRIN